jgi:hypothetical protein
MGLQASRESEGEIERVPACCLSCLPHVPVFPLLTCCVHVSLQGDAQLYNGGVAMC